MSLSRALDLLSDALLIIDVHGVLRHCNVRGAALFAREVVGVDRDGVIEFEERPVQEFVLTALAGQHTLPVSRAMVVGTNGIPRMSILVDRLHDQLFALWLRTADPLPWRARHWVAETFGLSAAEARLVVALVEGMTLLRAAERFGVALGTVRVQLRSVYAKLGARRQSEVVARVARLLPPLRGL